MRAFSAWLIALLGCGSGPEAFSRCDSNISVAVSHEAEPLFSWTPADCRMQELNVTEDNQVRWLISDPDEANTLSSPLRYGQDVPGGSNSGGTPLHTGFFYQVDIWRVNEEGLPHRVVSQRFLHEVK